MQIVVACFPDNGLQEQPTDASCQAAPEVCDEGTEAPARTSAGCADPQTSCGERACTSAPTGEAGCAADPATGDPVDAAAAQLVNLALYGEHGAPTTEHRPGVEAGSCGHAGEAPAGVAASEQRHCGPMADRRPAEVTGSGGGAGKADAGMIASDQQPNSSLCQVPAAQDPSDSLEPLKAGVQNGSAAPEERTALRSIAAPAGTQLLHADRNPRDAVFTLNPPPPGGPAGAVTGGQTACQPAQPPALSPIALAAPAGAVGGGRSCNAATHPSAPNSPPLGASAGAASGELVLRGPVVFSSEPTSRAALPPRTRQPGLQELASLTQAELPVHALGDTPLPSSPSLGTSDTMAELMVRANVLGATQLASSQPLSAAPEAASCLLVLTDAPRAPPPEPVPDALLQPAPLQHLAAGRSSSHGQGAPMHCPGLACLGLSPARAPSSDPRPSFPSSRMSLSPAPAAHSLGLAQERGAALGGAAAPAPPVGLFERLSLSAAFRRAWGTEGRESPRGSLTPSSSGRGAPIPHFTPNSGPTNTSLTPSSSSRGLMPESSLGRQWCAANVSCDPHPNPAAVSPGGSLARQNAADGGGDDRFVRSPNPAAASPGGSLGRQHLAASELGTAVTPSALIPRVSLDRRLRGVASGPPAPVVMSKVGWQPGPGDALRAGGQAYLSQSASRMPSLKEEPVHAGRPYLESDSSDALRPQRAATEGPLVWSPAGLVATGASAVATLEALARGASGRASTAGE